MDEQGWGEGWRVAEGLNRVDGWWGQIIHDTRGVQLSSSQEEGGQSRYALPFIFCASKLP